ncbi:uncharacterized protein LOC132257378 [Phlebotomus argentipes]|uniref:uncharacterized protein LOC132257378 n=1 Tax=Phlebotomus argentipes TaxID=94469 RepID=UPI002892A9D2|nr:uncharacterized protein LOC132257378 [Phlebotomus argentipes]
MDRLLRCGYKCNRSGGQALVNYWPVCHRRPILWRESSLFPRFAVPFPIAIAAVHSLSVSSLLKPKKMADNAGNIELPQYVIDEIKQLAESVDMVKPILRVSQGSRSGDNFSGDVFRVIAVSEDGTMPDEASKDRLIYQKELHLFVKLAPRTDMRRKLYKSVLCFERERYMYDVILPRFQVFERKYLKSADRFHNYPQMVMCNLQENQEYLVLNDLRREGYWSPKRSTPLNIHQCRLVLGTMAKFHAISYAFKDQHPEEFTILTSKLIETMFATPITTDMLTFLSKKIEYGLSTLTEPDDGEYKRRLEKFGESFTENMISCVHVKDYGAIVHGDSWISNLIFRFKNNVEEEVKLLDWQLSRHTTPVLDLAYFIFCCTDEDVRIHLPELLDQYYDQLIRRIDRLGSRGTDLYPKGVFDDHCKRYMKYGLGLALMTLHSVTNDSENMPDVVPILENANFAEMESIAGDLAKSPAYISRMSKVIRDAVRFGYI